MDKATALQIAIKAISVWQSELEHNAFSCEDFDPVQSERLMQKHEELDHAQIELLKLRSYILENPGLFVLGVSKAPIKR